MNCKSCGTPLQENAKFCPCCGTATYTPVAPVPKPVEAPQTHLDLEDEIPSQYEPLGAWSYVWLRFLFAIPVVGFIFLLVYTFSDANLNRRSFARSYWCELLIATIVALLTIILYCVMFIVFGVSVGSSF